MAVAYQSIATTAWAAATSVTIAKPTGLAVGDVMIAVIALVDGGTRVITEPSGWTLEETVDITGEMRLDVWRKVATSDDVAATNFTWSVDSETQIAGAILRIDGQSSTQPIWEINSATAGNSATPSFANTITPLPANSLLIMVALGYDTVGGAVSSYAIVTSNPSWTERAELVTGNSVGYSLGIATASRPETTATGNSSVAGGDATSDWACILLSIAENKDVTVSETITMSDSKLLDVNALILDTITAVETVTTLVQRLWTKGTRNIRSWTKGDRDGN